MMHRGLPFGNTEARLWRRMTIFASVAGAAAVWAWGCAGPEAKNAPTGDEAVNSRELSGPALMDSTPVVVPASTSAFSHGPYYAGVPRSTKAKSQFKVLDKGDWLRDAVNVDIVPEHDATQLRHLHPGRAVRGEAVRR